MSSEQTRSGGAGLEQSCGSGHAGWITSAVPVAGVELFRAWFAGPAYARHRHDTYAIGVTEHGVQAFDYRGAAHTSIAGEVVVLHPDEAHDGRAGSAGGFGYRQAYIEPERIAQAVEVLSGGPAPLPFVADPVLRSAALRQSIRSAFEQPLSGLAADDLVLDLAAGLIGAARQPRRRARRVRVDPVAVERARAFLDAEKTRVVHSSELAAVSGLDRFELARQFRVRLGTSPYRYLLMRRLALARRWLAGGRALASVAAEAGFADQAHLTRAFGAAFGISPARYRRLLADEPGQDASRAGVHRDAPWSS